MAEARLRRTVRFRAAHHYGRPDWPAERNRAAFGEQSRRHEHLWWVTVSVVGPPRGDTGFVVDLAALDRVLREVVEPLEGADLNEVIPEVRSGVMQPSTESLARWVFDRLAPKIPAPARLERVRVAESSELAGEYPA